VALDHSTTPTPSQETTFQGNLFTPTSSVLELRYVSCAYETGRPAVQGISFAGTRRGNSLPTWPFRMWEDDILRAIAGFEPFAPANFSYRANSCRRRIS